MNGRPPLVPRVALRLLLPADRLEEIEGDLLELFHARLGESGAVRARVRYWLDAASVLRERRRFRPARETRSPRAHAWPAPLFLREGSMRLTLLALVTELRFAARSLAKRPGYTAVAAFTLALGIGSSVAIFSVVNAIVLQPLPYPDPDRIVEVLHHAPALNMPELRSSPGLIAHYRQSAQTFTHVAGYDVRLLNLTGSGAAERIRAVAATPELLDVLATRPAIGRAFTEADTAKNGPLVTILTDALWRSRFGADPAVVGRTIHLDGQAAEVVGVMPPGFSFPDTDARLFVPLRIDLNTFGAFGMTSIARVQPGVTIEAARREIEQLQQRIPEWFPGVTKEVLAGFGWSSAVEPLRDRIVADISKTLWILFATVGIVLLVAAANVANLFLVRAESRQRELAVRSALGAGRSRLATTFLAESLVLATLGGLLGLLFADGGTRLLVAYGPPGLPRLHEVRLDTSVFAFAALLSVVTAVLLATLPMLGFARRSFMALIRDGGRGTTAGRSRQRARQMLIVAQVAMALVLLVGAGLMFRSVAHLSAVNPGFRANGLLTAGLSVGARTTRADATALYHRMLDEMAHVPGVSAVGAASVLPVAATSMNGSGVEIRSQPRADSDPPPIAMYSGVTAGYLETLGAPLLAGRAPTRADEDQGRAVAWINTSFARQILRGGRTIGESIKLHETWVEIVGVVGDVRTTGLGEAVQPMMYLPLSNPDVRLDVLYAVLRTSGDPASLAPSVRLALDRVDASVPVTLRTMDDIVARSLAQTTFTMTLLAIAASIGLVLGIVGLYAAISYIAMQRTAEIGVRLALGAKPTSVCLMLLRQGAIVAIAGIFVGLVVAWSSARFMSSILFEISVHDPATYTVVAALLLAVSLFATYVPARKAAAIDPVQALRNET